MRMFTFAATMGCVAHFWREAEMIPKELDRVRTRVKETL